MPISHEHKCIFVHIPKTGGTSIESALGVLENPEIEHRDLFYGRIHSADLKSRHFTSSYLQHLTMHELTGVLPAAQLNDYFTFAFVRNPWSRVVSNYFDISNSLGFGYQQMPFEEFIYKIKDSCHIHVKPQYQFIYDNNKNLIIDFIGKYESLNKDWRYCCGKIGLTYRVLPFAYGNIRKPYAAYYTKETKQLIADMYQEDIELFGYTFKQTKYFQLKKNYAIWRSSRRESRMKYAIKKVTNKILRLFIRG